MKRLFGKLPNGEPVYEVTLKNDRGFIVRVLTLGGAVTAIEAEDKFGKRDNVVLCYDTVEDYTTNPAYLGVTVGRIAGRMELGVFEMDGQRIQLDTSLHPHALHGGQFGIHWANWRLVEVSESTLIMELIDESDSGKTPGTVKIEACYQVHHKDQLDITYTITADQKTYVNLANHSYFNLTGNAGDTVESHSLMIQSSAFAALDDSGLPLVGLTAKEGPFDLREPKYLSEVFRSQHPQIRQVDGFDHPFSLDLDYEAICLSHLESGRRLTVSTNQPYVVVYTGNALSEAKVPSGKVFLNHGAICLETQDIPNAPNRPQSEGCFIMPNESVIHKTSYRFDTLAVANRD